MFYLIFPLFCRASAKFSAILMFLFLLLIFRVFHPNARQSARRGVRFVYNGQEAEFDEQKLSEGVEKEGKKKSMKGNLEWGHKNLW